MDKYLKILRALKAGRQVSRTDWEYFLKFRGEIDEKQLAELQKKEFKDMNPEEIEAAMDGIVRASFANPANKEKFIQLAQEAEQGKLSDDVASGLNTLLAVGDIATSLGQIKEGDRLVNESQRPARPSVPGRDPLLTQQIDNALRGTMDQSRALAPAQLQILDQYLSDLNTAKVASTGQAGTYGALAQEAANRRNKSALDLVPLQDSIKRQEQSRLDGLLAQRQQETQNIYENQARLYPHDLQQYNLDQIAAGQLGSQGRQNLRTSFSNATQILPDLVAKLATRQKYNNIFNSMSQYGEDNAKIAADAYKGLDERYSGTMTSDDTPFYWDQFN